MDLELWGEDEERTWEAPAAAAAMRPMKSMVSSNLVANLREGGEEGKRWGEE